MKILSFDPGPEKCGLVLLDTSTMSVSIAMKDATVSASLVAIESWAHEVDLVAIERVQSYGISGSSLLKTSEVVGRLQQQAVRSELPVELVYRREVLQHLDVTGRGNKDSLVRHRLIETFGGTKSVAVGTKKAPGPCYGVSSHAWSALAVAMTALSRREN